MTIEEQPVLGTVKDANGVAHTKLVTATPRTRVTPKAIKKTFRPTRWAPSDAQPGFRIASHW